MSSATPNAVPYPQKSLGHVLVTGGNGFLGGNIVDLLLARSVVTKLSVLDLRPPEDQKENVEYHFGDITNLESMQQLFSKLRPDVVIHTASPHHTISDKNIMEKVNIGGTKTMIQVARESGVKAFVYTSSASVISDNSSDLVNADESYPLCTGKAQPFYYTHTKALAEEQVLSSNRPSTNPTFVTCAIRPASIFGVGDTQLLPGGLSAYYKGQTRFQVGNNENLFDFTEVTNIAHAHHLAAAALLATSERQAKGQSAPLDTEKVDGEAFFITNDAPVYFFDFARKVWRAAGDTTKPSQVWVLPQGFALFLATVFEWVFWILQKGKPNLSRQQVSFTCMTRYYNIDKAKKRLGYRPVVGLEDGIKRGVADAIRRGTVPGMPEHLKGTVPESAETRKEK